MVFYALFFLMMPSAHMPNTHWVSKEKNKNKMLVDISKNVILASMGTTHFKIPIDLLHYARLPITTLKKKTLLRYLQMLEIWCPPNPPPKFLQVL